MTDADRLKEIEEQLTRFEKENPQLAKTLQLMGVAIEEYNKILLNITARDVVTSNSTEVHG
jgi:hypothetical protein